MVSDAQIIDTKPLGDLVEKIVGGGTPSRKKLEFYNGNIPWATVKDLRGQFLQETLEYISEDAIRESSANLIDKGNVILATRMALGKAFINLVDMAINQDLKALYPKPFIDSKFLLYAILNKAKKIERQGSGTTVKGIRLENLRAIPIDVPPLKEQQKIAAILSSVDNAIEQTKQIIEQTEKVKKGLMQQLLTKGIGHTEFKKTAIGEVPKEWELSPFTDAVHINHTYHIDKGTAVDFVEIAAVTTDSPHISYFVKRIVGKSGGTRFKNNDVLFARITPCTENGKTALISELTSDVGMGSTEFIVLSPIKSKMVPTYLYYIAKYWRIRNKRPDRMWKI